MTKPMMSIVDLLEGRPAPGEANPLAAPVGSTGVIPTPTAGKPRWRVNAGDREPRPRDEFRRCCGQESITNGSNTHSESYLSHGESESQRSTLNVSGAPP